MDKIILKQMIVIFNPFNELIIFFPNFNSFPSEIVPIFLKSKIVPIIISTNEPTNITKKKMLQVHHIQENNLE